MADQPIEGNTNKKKEIKKAPNEKEIATMKNYNIGLYSKELKQVQLDINKLEKNIKEVAGIKEEDTGLAPQANWNIPADVYAISHEAPLHVGRVTQILQTKGEEPRYMVNIKKYPTYLVGLSDELAATDIEEGMRVGCERGSKYRIHLPLPPKISPRISMMQVEEKPDITYADIGGCIEQIKRIREVVEMPLLEPDRFTKIGVEPPKGVLFYGPPGTGKTLCARAVANRTDACFIRVIGSELIKKYIGQGAQMVRELFEMAKTKKACIIFFDEVDAFGGTRFHGAGGHGDNEVQRTMLELVTQLDGFDSRGTIKVLMATNRPDTLDPALVRPGRIDRRVEFGLPDVKARANIFRIHTKSMSVDKTIRHDLIARLCPNITGADIRSVCTEAGMFALRSRRKVVSEKDFLDAVHKVVKGYAKFSSTPSYMTHN